MKWKWIKKGNSGTIKQHRFNPHQVKIVWGLNIKPLSVSAKNHVITRYFFSKLSERAINIVLKSYEHSRYGGRGGDHLLRWDPISRKIYPKSFWEYNVKNTIEDTCANCGNNIRVKIYKFNQTNFQCNDCIDKKVKLNSRVYINKVEELKTISIDYIKEQRERIINHSKNNQHSIEFKQNFKHKRISIAKERNQMVKEGLLKRKISVKQLKREICKKFLLFRKLIS